jgi:hypothetical protein
MGRALTLLLAFLGGAVVGYLACLGVYIAASSAGLTDDREGALAMGVIFMIGPAVALVCGIAAAAVAARRGRPDLRS